MATVMYLDRLHINTESSYVSTMFSPEMLAKIKEIYTSPSGSNYAWVVFENPEDAKKAAARYDGFSFGPVGQKIYSAPWTESDIPTGEMNLLSRFQHDLENQIDSCTVEVSNLPENHPGRNLNQLLEPVQEQFDMYAPSGDPYFDFDPDEIVRARVKAPGIALVQLAEPGMAKNIVHRFAGTYWKNATLNARCVPDEEMEDLLAEDRSSSEGKDVMLFVTGINAGTSKTRILELFKDFSVNDVNIPPGSKGFCFIFLRQDDANAVLARFGRGVLHEGKMVRVELSDKGKKKGGMETTGFHPAAGNLDVAYATTDLKVRNLPYGVAESTLRIVFQGFRVSKVIVKEGYAFVSIATDEVEHAIAALQGRKIGDRVISVKVGERWK
tara:strand:+ start:3857 stop:5005 length:1149 start_codon:yes stop_codon:yes gene_type:complete